MFEPFNQYVRGRTALLIPAVLACLLSLAPGAEAPNASLSDRVQSAIEEHVYNGFRRAGLEGELTGVHLPANLHKFDPESSIRFLRTFLPKQAAGRHVIGLQLIPPGQRPVNLNLTIECVAVIHGWQAPVALKRGERLDADRLQRKTQRVSDREENYYTADMLPKGYRMASTLRPGQFLQYRHIEKEPEVRRGDVVTIYFHRNSVTLIGPGRARREGQIGDLIPVIATSTGKRLFGILEENGIVVVE